MEILLFQKISDYRLKNTTKFATKIQIVNVNTLNVKLKVIK